MLRRMGLVGVLVAVTCVASTAVADISNVIFYVEATSAYGTDSFAVTKDQLSYNPTLQTWNWSLTGSHDFWSPTMDLIGTLDSANVALCDVWYNTPRVVMNWAFTAGDEPLTDVHVRSPRVSFFQIPDGLSEGRATTSYSLTNIDGGGDAEIQGLGYSGHGMSTMWYNSAAEPPNSPDGTEWAHLVDYVRCQNQNDTITISGKQPTSGFMPINPDDLYNMSVEAGFSMTALDQMSANASWFVKPEPASLTLLVLPALLVFRRRR